MGDQYLDLVNSWGAPDSGARASGCCLGHHRDGSQRLEQPSARRAPEKLSWHERIVASYPGLEQVRFVSSGTEAVMSAIRVARAFTSRDLIVKFSGCYHGHADHLLVAAGSRPRNVRHTRPQPAYLKRSPPARGAVLPLDDEAAVQTTYSHAKARVSRPSSSSRCPPTTACCYSAASSSRSCCDLTQEARLPADIRRSHFPASDCARGGVAELVGIVPDMATFGKVIGGGMPVGGFGGSREIMKRLAPLGDTTYQAGTLSGKSGNAMACGHHDSRHPDRRSQVGNGWNRSAHRSSARSFRLRRKPRSPFTSCAQARCSGCHSTTRPRLGQPSP